MGCDVRLLGIIKTLLANDVEVSLFFRSHTHCKAFATNRARLAATHPRGYNEEWLRRMCEYHRLPFASIIRQRRSAAYSSRVGSMPSLILLVLA